jgi:hypothetical protein
VFAIIGLGLPMIGVQPVVEHGVCAGEAKGAPGDARDA